MSHGPSCPASLRTRRRGSAPSWLPATAGMRPASPVHGVEWRSGRWGWQSVPSAVAAAAWSSTVTETPPPTSPLGLNVSMPRPRTAKRADGSSMPLEGKALAIALAMVEPAPVKGEPTPTPSWREQRTPEKGAARPPHTRVVRQALVLGLGPGAPGGHGDLQRHPELVDALHLAAAQLGQPLALAGGDLEHQLVVDLEDHAAGQAPGGQGPGDRGQ